MGESVTVVPAEFLDALEAAPYVPNEPLQRAMRRARAVVVRDDPAP